MSVCNRLVSQPPSLAFAHYPESNAALSALESLEIYGLWPYFFPSFPCTIDTEHTKYRIELGVLPHCWYRSDPDTQVARVIFQNQRAGPYSRIEWSLLSIVELINPDWR